MKKILFCIYIITTCTYLHPSIAATCQAFFIADPNFDASEMLTINGETYNTGLRDSDDFKGRTGYVCDDGDADGKECDYNTIVYTTNLYSIYKVFACIDDAGVDDSWVAIDLEFCLDSDFKDLKNHTNAEITVWDTKNQILQNTHGIVQQPCIKHNCKEGYRLNTVNQECELIPTETEEPDAQPAAQQPVTTTQTTTQTTAPEPEEPVDEYKDIIKKIENEISEYSKKCSKYTKPQAE